MEQPSGEGKVILIAEDEQSLIHFLRRNLEASGYIPHIVESGQEALRLATTIHPDLIVLDVGLPDANGVDICRQIKQDPRCADIPVLFLTGQSDHSDRIIGFNAGAQDYLTKPFNMQEFQARLRAILRAQDKIHQKREEIDQHQEELMAIINHELRAPLTVISMASQILAENHQLSDQRREQLIQSIRGSAGALTHIIDDLLYLANPVRHLRSTQLRTVLANTVEETRPLVLEHGLHLVARLPQDLPALVVDEAQLRRSLRHLLDNALKFTPRGGVITLSATVVEHGQIVAGDEHDLPVDLLPENDTGPWVDIAVRDTGIGIAPEHHQHVFEPFYQVDSSATRAAQGMGLGLAVVATFARAHQGHLAVSSRSGMGTEIHLALPLKPKAEDVKASLGITHDGPSGA
jgi:signal transduction histidine kinase